MIVYGYSGGYTTFWDTYMYHFWHRGTTFSDDDFQLTMILVEELGEVAVLGLSENVVALEIQTSWFPIFSYENCKFVCPAPWWKSWWKASTHSPFAKVYTYKYLIQAGVPLEIAGVKIGHSSWEARLVIPCTRNSWIPQTAPKLWDVQDYSRP